MFLLAIFFILLASVNCDYRRICYYTNWAQYRPSPQNFLPEDVNPYLCTHYVFYFSMLVNNHLTTREWNDDVMYERFNTRIHVNNPSAKTLLAVDGEFSTMLASPENRTVFIESSISYLRTWNFDGLDLDFQYPGVNDKEGYTQLCQEARAAFEQEAIDTGREVLLLTAAVPAFKPDIDDGFDIAAISPELDYLSIKAYDFHLPIEAFTGHNSPLYPRSGEDDPQLNQDWAANYWFENGCPKDKIVVGMAASGRCFVLADSSQNGMGAPSVGACEAGTYTQLPGFLAYYEVCPPVDDGSAVVEWHDEHQVPYAYRNTDWVGYDSVTSVRGKMQWLKANEYSGFMLWALDLDDFNGRNCQGGHHYPLLFAMVDELYDGITTLPPPVETTPPPEVCKFKTFCEGDGYYPDPNNCDGFYQCIGGVPYYTECTIPNTIYDPYAVECDYISTVDFTYVCCKCPEKGVDHNQGPCNNSTQLPVD